MADQSTNKLHLAFLPWLGFGHMLPFLELAKKIAQRGHKVSFISTPMNINRLPKVPKDLEPLINFVGFPLPKVKGLPENAEATFDISQSLFPQLREAQDGLQEPIAHFLQTQKPDWVIYDYSFHWLPQIASKLGIFAAYFISVSASTTVKLISFVKFGKDLDSEPNFQDEKSRLKESILGSHVCIIRSCREFEEEELNILQQHFQKPLVPFGLLPYNGNNDHEDIKKDDDQAWVHWLNKQEKRSVVYVALGSEVGPTQQDFHELALGLELSGLPFFWVLNRKKNSRLRTNEGDENRGMKYLPDGFEERTKGQGLVWTNWAPQRTILAHKSIGGFVTHCGWSSTIEGLQYGHPLIMLPFYMEQIACAKVLVDKKVGIEIPRDGEDKSFTKHQVAKSVRLVMVEEEGKIYHDEAKKLGAIFGDHAVHDKYIDECLDYLGTQKMRAAT